jgi:mannopine transport system permease protein
MAGSGLAHTRPSPRTLLVAPGGVARLQLGRFALYGYVLLVIAFLLLPVVLIAPISFGSAEHLEFPPRGWSLRWYASYLGDQAWIGPTLFSLRIALLTMVVATVIGTTAALALARGSLPGRTLVNALITAPLIIPAIIYAIAILFLFAPLRLSGTTLGFVLAHTVLAAPYVVLIVSAALSRVDPALELAALSLGASRMTAFRRITLPLVAPGVLTGAAFAFLASFDDATVSFFISGVTDKSLPRKMFENVEFNVSPVLAVVSTLVTVATLALMGGVQMWAAARTRRITGCNLEAAALGVELDGASEFWRALDAAPPTEQLGKREGRA